MYMQISTYTQTNIHVDETACDFGRFLAYIHIHTHACMHSCAHTHTCAHCNTCGCCSLLRICVHVLRMCMHMYANMNHTKALWEISFQMNSVLMSKCTAYVHSNVCKHKICAGSVGKILPNERRINI